MVRTRNAAWLVVLLVAALGALVLSPLRFAGDLEARLGAAIAPVTASLHRATRPASDVLLHAGQLSALTEENAALRDRVAQLESEAATLREGRTAEEQARALRSAVGDASYLEASVTVLDPSPGRRGLLIDRGAAHGVVAGQAVLGPGAALIGVIAEVQPAAARVRLIDDPRSAIAVALQQSKTPGLLAAGAGGLHLDFVPTGSTVAVGDLVLTSPIGGQLPAGLLVGRVQAVEVQPEALFTTVRVEPYAAADRLLRVLVVTSVQAPAP